MLRDSKEPRLTSRTWIPKPILAPDLTGDVPLEDVYVGRLIERKDISRAIQSISIAWPGFGHLKRCSASKLLLAPVKMPEDSTDKDETVDTTRKHVTLSQEKIRNLLTSKGFDVSLLEENLDVVKVPSRAPKTKIQAVACAKIWPINFHPDPNTEAVISGTIFTDQQLCRIEKYMRIAIEAARRAATGNEECNGSAIVVNPEDGRILAVAASQMNKHPMWHAVILAVDLVARIQGGGAYDLADKENTNMSGCVNTEISKTSGIGESTSILQEFKTVPGSSSSLDEEDNGSLGTEATGKTNVKRKHVDEVPPLCYPPTLSDLRLPEPVPLDVKSNRRIKRNNGSCASKKKKKNEGDSDEPTKNDVTSSVAAEENPERLVGSYEEKTGPYLCTNYWIFTVKEPCALCAMALLHSRVARIFYGTPSTNYGVLGSRAILHATPGLNHRYQVWSGILEEECNEISRQMNSGDSVH